MTVGDITGNITCSGGGAGTLLRPGLAGSGPQCLSGLPGAASGLVGGGNNGRAGIGAGGGGYYGGGAGAIGGGGGVIAASGGGGGSDYPDPASLPAGVSTVTVANGVQSGNGVITVAFSTAVAVTFAGASATRTARGVVVRWRTGAEAEMVGFHVYRSRGRSWTRVTRLLVAAKGSLGGAAYRFLDSTARRGVPYRYRIKAVNRDGTASWFGPVHVT